MRRAPSWSKRAPTLLAGALLASLGFFGYQASAASPPLTYQGQLFINNKPITDDTYTLSIGIFRDQAAGNHVCGDTNVAVTTTGGWFRHTMQDPTCLSAIAAAAGTTLWVQVSGHGGALGTGNDVILATNPISAGVTALHADAGGGEVGDIVPSMLSPSEFTALRGPDWVLADGASYSGSRYAAITGSIKVPDLRGVFLRGADQGRTDGKGNPEGDLKTGHYQSDMLKAHNHLVASGAATAAPPGTTQQVFASPLGTSGSLVDPAGVTSTVGGAETRPRNVTVNYYIKIN